MSSLGSTGAGPVRYRLYGLDLESSRALATPVPRSCASALGSPPDVILDWRESGPGEGPGEDSERYGERIWESTIRLSSGEPAVMLYRDGDVHLIRYTGIVEYELQEDAARIECRVLDPGSLHLVELFLLGLVLAYWLELHGRLALHGSGVVSDEGGVAFLGAKGSGKSSLAAASMRTGSPMISDDLLAVTFDSRRFVGPDGSAVERAPVLSPAYPQMRMWPDVARHFVADPADLPPVEPGGRKRRVSLPEHWDVPFGDAPVSLERIYLPERSEPGELAEIRIEPVPPSEAVIELVRESFLVKILQAAGLQGPRLERLGRLVRTVPVRRLLYPSGLDRLPPVVEAIRRDAAGADEESRSRAVGNAGSASSTAGRS